MTALPPEIDANDEIAITWENDEDGVKVVAALGEASITVECAYDAAPTVPWLVGALPTILEAAWSELEKAGGIQRG